MSSTDHEKHSLVARHSKNADKSARSDSRERASLHMHTGSNHAGNIKKSTLDIESISINQIDERDEENHISPERSIVYIDKPNGSLDMALGNTQENNHLKLEMDRSGQANIKLRNLSQHRTKEQKQSSQG